MPHSRPINLPTSNFARCFSGFVTLFVVACLGGCNFLPDVRHKPQYHNPFPQLQTIAILPFRNQSQDPTLSGERVTAAYSNELQSFAGFEVLPIGVVAAQLEAYEEQLQRPLSRPEDMQQFARYLGVDAVLHGAITDFDAYYPPRMTMKVNWYAANPGFHPIPPGYGLPWGTKAEKKIPEWVRLEAERSLAREQLATQTPVEFRKPWSEADEAIDYSKEMPMESPQPADAALPESGEGDGSSRKGEPTDFDDRDVSTAAYQIQLPESISAEATEEPAMEPLPLPRDSRSREVPGIAIETKDGGEPAFAGEGEANPLPEGWPDPHGFIPSPPKSTRPVAEENSLPIISHMRTYNGHDEDFTNQLSECFYFRDEARFGGWEAYLQRSEDFIRFCCHLHIVETLAARGGQLKSRTVVRWPIDRYER